jgi:hypothetical protein
MKQFMTMQISIKTLLLLFLVVYSLNTLAQNDKSSNTSKELKHKYRISVPGIIIPQLFEKSWNNRSHTQHIELHFKYNLDEKNIIGVKFATWRLFQPMGIQWWDGLLDKVDNQSEYYPGHVRETGLGFSYQRMLWKGLFATAEILPLHKTYLDLDNNKVATGFKLYNSLHLGYHIAFGKKKQFFVEPQVHSQVWLFDTNTPENFKELDSKWKNYFLFEPNIYLGIKF